MKKLTEAQIAAFLALHDPSAQEEQMVYEIWEDGEVTLTKGGSLYGQRSLHSVWDPERYMAPKTEPIPVERMPKQSHDKSHGWIQVKGGVNEALEILFGKCHWSNRWYV